MREAKQMVLEAVNVSKTIKSSQILKRVNLRFESGKIYGIVGRNGSGKTMLFRVLSGLIKCSEGKVYFDGRELKKDFAVLPNLGILIENTEMYPEFTGYYNLKLLADIRKKIGKAEIQRTMFRVGLDPADKRIVRKYSLGMRQKLALAQAIMEKPDILLLDEPTNGLDEIAVDKIRTILMQEKERGALIVITSHNREDIVRLSDEVYRISDGYVRKEKAIKTYEIE